ncbi:DeoR/GlpR family transcriptional regulator [Aliamphritea ceti]|uniref:DeoR/GlpR family transcriptional regulator n=1 Tax=Aliamphritea ceti TaxID=1524258 RepID=UPI0021C4B6FF|nr:DeoR/GlpR family transcriptional regulator [Aliamphritea ceti]
MNQSQRHAEILKLVQHKGFVSIDELVTHFQVTPQTIRRDLNQLADEKKLLRHHGGAGGESSTVNVSYQSRKIMNLEAKERIARELVKLIPDGASLFINIGTTTETIARALLNHRDLKVVTNNIHVATILATKEDFTVIIAAGEVRHRDGGIVGEATSDFISQFHMDFCIIGISGISPDGSLLDFDYREVRVAQAMIEHSRSVILAVDNSKFGRSAMVKQGSITQVDHLYTDMQPPQAISEILDEHEIHLQIA